MRTGTIESEPTLDWEGDTLVADADTGDTVLFVDSAIDFDEDTTQTRWLVVADSDPLEYVDVDKTANTVTLADPLAADYEAELPVVMWDPTVGATGAKVQEYRAQVRLADGTGTPTVTIPHALIPLNGVANLVGASVGIDERRGEWYVDEVYGRDAVVDGSAVGTPSTSVFLVSTALAGIATWTRIIWPTGTGGNAYFRALASDGLVTVPTTGRYLIVGNVQWDTSNSTGGRRARVVLVEPDNTEVVLRQSMHAPEDNGGSQFQVVVSRVLTAGQRIGFDIRYSVDGDATIIGAVGAADGSATALELTFIAQV